MPKLDVRVPHNLSQQEARSRLERFAEMVQQKYEKEVTDLHQEWDGDTLQFRFKTYGIAIDGGIAVADSALNLVGNIPFAAMMFKGKIESTIRERLEHIVAD